MDFGVLGPIIVRDGDRDLTPPRGKERALLALLLLRSNEIVTVDTVLDALWGEQPPATAHHAVEVYVSSLRRHLGRDPGSRVLTRPFGYVLRIADGELDATRYEALVDRAAGLVEDDPDAAVAIFEGAESLWRGRAFGELADEPFAGPEVARLDARRATARDQRIDAQLAAGRHLEVVAELEALVRTEPWHEALHRQLMLALYRSGRQADALDRYRTMRRALSDELGLEPSPETERLQLAILRHDPVLAAPGRRGATAPVWPVQGARSDADAMAEGRSGPPPGPTEASTPERRLVSALIVASGTGSRRGGERLDPERAELQRRRLVDGLRLSVEPLGGVVIPVAGVAAMGVFGSERAREDHVAAALHAALTVRRRLAEERASDAPPRIVVDSVEVVVDPRDRSGWANLLFDDLAALLESAAADEVLVGRRAASVAPRRFELAPAARAQGEPAPARRLLLERPREQDRDVALELVGRKPELGAIERAWRRSTDRREPRVVLVYGDPGIGKSALIRTWAGRASRAGATVSWGRCLPYGRGVTYWPLAEILRQRLGIDADAPAEDVRERLGLRPTLGLTLGLADATDLHPMAAQQRLFAEWVAFIEDEAGRAPSVFVIEDLHWAEGPLIELLAHLVGHVRAPVLFIASARPDFVGADRLSPGRARRASVLWLEPLTRDESRSLVADRLGGRPDASLDAVLERAEGNPFFIEELLRSLIDGDRVHPSAAGWVIEHPEEVDLPDSVRTVLASRFELLEPDQREGLQVASVIGRRFDVPRVETLMARPLGDIDELVRREFVRPLAPSEQGPGERYAFKHALTRDAAYQSLTIARRARLHAALADALEAADVELTDRPSILAYHYGAAVAADVADVAWHDEASERARLEAQARRWCLEAARIAVGRYAIDEAILLLERAAELGPGRAEASRIALEVGRANILRYDGVGFWTAMQRAIDTADSDEARGAIYAELAFETAFRWAIWKRMPARELVDGWIEHATRLAQPDSRARVYALVAAAYWHPLDAGEAIEEAIAIAEDLDDPVALSYALDAHALAAFVAGDDRGAHARWARRLSLAERITDLDHLEDLYGSGIAANVALGRFDEARRYAGLHDDVAMQLSPHHRVHAVAMHLELEELAGGWERIGELVARTEEAVATNLATPCVRNERSLLVCALAASRLGRPDEARRLEAAADALGMEGYEAVFDPVRIRLAIDRGDIDEVRRMLPLGMPPPTKNWWRLSTQVARLAGYLASGRVDEVERVAVPLLAEPTLLEPFAARALGVVRRDEALLEHAAARFAALGIVPDPVFASAGRVGAEIDRRAP